MLLRQPITLHTGTPEVRPDPVPLRAGPLTVLFDEGDLRCVSLDGRELLRRVYVAVRDRNWDTAAAALTDVQVIAGADHFRVTYRAQHRDGDIAFAWDAEITGDADGRFRFTMSGEALASFLRNRIGFCVLHPLEGCVGRACRVEHTDGSVTEGEFPRFISPHQPFFDIRAVSHPVRNGMWMQVRFEGDVFEMEDHRNWTDASFKTYCTPLRLPFPVRVEAGERVAQAVTVELCPGPTSEDEPVSARPTRGETDAWIRIGEPAGVLPRIGLGIASHGGPLSETEIERLQVLRPDHLRVELEAVDPSAPARLAQAGREAAALGAEVQLCLTLPREGTGQDGALSALLTAARALPVPIQVCFAFAEGENSTSAATAQRMRNWLAGMGRPIPLGGGARAYFAELNRGRPPSGELHVVTYSINPQAHSCDTRTLMENLAGQTAVVESARQICGDLPLAVGPVTLRPRFNPHLAAPAVPRPGDTLPFEVDERQMSLAAAAWTVGSLAALAVAGVSAVTYYETTGWRGVMEREHGCPHPDRFQSGPGEVFPLYHVLADVGEWPGAEVLRTISTEPLRAAALALRRDNCLRILVANLLGSPLTVTVAGVNGARGVMRSLDVTTTMEAMRDPVAFRAREPAAIPPGPEDIVLSLLPYAVVRLDIRLHASAE